MSATDDYDLIIAGGGMVGASLACALRDAPLKLAVVEATPFSAPEHAGFDARTLALGHGSRRILDTLGLWDAIAERGVTPIHRIHVSDRGHLGSSHLDRRDEGLDALGYVTEIRTPGAVLHAALQAQANVDFLCPAQVADVRLEPLRAHVRLDTGDGEREITGRLLVAADGGNSPVRRRLGIGSFRIGYGQHAIIANVAVNRPHGNVAYERFTEQGPMALLPARDPDGGERMFALVWTVPDDAREAILALDDDAFLARLQARFGERAGRFEQAGRRHAYPLGWMQSREHVRPRLAVIGNAAHTLHPVAGQGFNLGLRDVATLAQVVVDGVRAGRDPGDMELLRSYARWRRRDQLTTALFTDALVRVFSNDLPPVALARNLGLTLLDTVPPLKRLLARQAMGFGGKLPRLARGLPL